MFSVPSGGAAAETIVAAAGKVMFILGVEPRRLLIEVAAIVAIDKRVEDVSVGVTVAVDTTAIEEVFVMLVDIPASWRDLVKEGISMPGGYMYNHFASMLKSRDRKSVV